jgi:ribosomal protein S18 acetylase RimI-like enzyme
MFKVSKLTEENITQSAEIIRRSFETVAKEFGITEENVPNHSSFLKDESLLKDFQCGTTMFGLFEWDEQVGFAAIESSDNEVYYLEKVSVLPDFRHKKGGQELVTFIEDYIRNEGGKTISIGIIYENTLLYEWYKKFGYEETGTKVYPNFPFTVCFMKKDLM